MSARRRTPDEQAIQCIRNRLFRTTCAEGAECPVIQALWTAARSKADQSHVPHRDAEVWFARSIADAINALGQGGRLGMSPREVADLLSRMADIANELHDKASLLLRDQRALEMCAGPEKAQPIKTPIEADGPIRVVEQVVNDGPFFMLQRLTERVAPLGPWAKASAKRIERMVARGRSKGASKTILIAPTLHLGEAWWLATGRQPGINLEHHGERAGQRGGDFPHFVLSALQAFGWGHDRAADNKWAREIQRLHTLILREGGYDLALPRT